MQALRRIVTGLCTSITTMLLRRNQILPYPQRKTMLNVPWIAAHPDIRATERQFPRMAFFLSRL